MRIESRQNPLLKRLVELREAKGRREQGRFLIDTPRDIARALECGLQICAAYTCAEFPTDAALLQKVRDKKIPEVELGVRAFEAVCYRENPNGLLLEAQSWQTRLEDLKLKAPQLVIVAEDIEKPGNLGTLLRTADATGVDAVLGCNRAVELFNPNTLRGSSGAAFSVPYATASLPEILAYLRAHKLPLVATSPAAKKSFWDADFRGAMALAVGSEAWGLSPELLAAADEVVSLPMRGVADSLNVSAASAVMLYEVLRQRRTL